MNLVNEITYNNITYKVGDVIQAYIGLPINKDSAIITMQIKAIDLNTNIILGYTKYSSMTATKPSLIIKKSEITLPKKVINFKYTDTEKQNLIENVFFNLLKNVKI